MRQSDLNEFSPDGVECPTCGDDGFESVKAMKIHHARAHGESIAGVETDCPECGDTFTVRPYELDDSEDGPFCSKDCYAEWKQEPVTLTCETCGDEFTVPPRWEDRRFCSRACFGEWNSGENHPHWEGGTVTVECLACGDELERKRNRATGKNFCDKQCESEWKTGRFAGDGHPRWGGGKRTVMCDWCGDETEKWPSSIDGLNFCSTECNGKHLSQRQQGAANPVWNGGRDFYTAIRRNLSTRSWDSIAADAREADKYQCQLCGESQSDIGRKLDTHHIVPVMAGGDNGDYNLMAFCPSCHKKAEAFTREYFDIILAD